MSETPAVVLQNVVFSYGRGQAQQLQFDCEFRRSATTAIMGASGAGKSTLLSLVAGFERAKSGKILIEERDCTGVPPADRPLSMVFQENNLFAHMSIFDNVALGISPSLSLAEREKKQVRQALADVGLEGYGARLPAELSGGERQRVSLARVLVRDKPILLLDEAFASLGPGLRADMLDLVSTLSRTHELTTLMVTHAPEDALRIAQDLLFLADEGIAYSGNVQELLKSTGQHPALVTYLGEQAREKD